MLVEKARPPLKSTNDQSGHKIWNSKSSPVVIPYRVYYLEEERQR
jgi:hypothetical protein